MKTPILLGITGTRGSGKTTIANFLNREYNFVEMTLADPLKEICMSLFGLTYDQTYGSYKIKEKIIPELGVSPREIFQKFGTDLMREKLHEVMPDLKIKKGMFWLEIFKKRYKNQMKEWPENIIVSDVRFLDEARVIKELGGYIMKIERPGLKLERSNHRSELELEKIIPNFIIIGKEGVKNLEKQVKTWYEFFFGDEKNGNDN